MRTKMGRPPKPKNERASARFGLRLTKEELLTLRLRAERTGQTVAEYVRSRLFEEKDREGLDG